MTDELASALKLIHIGALMFWIGPALGGWWMLRLANHRFGEPGMVSQFFYQAFLRLLWVEHVAFVCLLASGGALAAVQGWFGQSWLTAKLVVVVCIIVPMEATDIWLGHVRLPALFRQRHPSRPYSREESGLLAFYHGRFTGLALWTMPAAVTAVLWLAVSKTW